MLLTLLVLAGVGLSTVGHYGVSTDEPLEVIMVRWNRELITTGRPLPRDLEFYGTVFNVAAEAAYLSLGYVEGWISRGELSSQDKHLSRGFFGDRIRVKHVLTFLISLLAYAGVMGVVGLFCGFRYAWLGGVVLALMPRFWGHSFFNPKDIPFAVLFTLGTFLAAHLAVHYLEARGAKSQAALVSAKSLSFGIFCGLLTGIRIAGFVLIFFLLLTHVLLAPKKSFGEFFASLLGVWSQYALVVIFWVGTVICFHPSSWGDPAGWFLRVVEYFAAFPKLGAQLFEGELLTPQQLPWYYVPKWLFITVPLFHQVCFLLGVVWLSAQYRNLPRLQRAGFILVLLQIFFLPLASIIKGSVVYDGGRHFLFVLPGIAVITAVFVIQLHRMIVGRSLRLVFCAVIAGIFLTISYRMVSLHPYEYVYFNEWTGGLRTAHQEYDTDYWGLSLRQATEWLNQHAPSGSQIVVAGPIWGAALFADSRLEVKSAGLVTAAREEINLSGVNKPYYYLSWTRRMHHTLLPECPVVYQVVREGAPLSVIKRCS